MTSIPCNIYPIYVTIIIRNTFHDYRQVVMVVAAAAVVVVVVVVVVVNGRKFPTFRS